MVETIQNQTYFGHHLKTEFIQPNKIQMRSEFEPPMYSTFLSNESWASVFQINLGIELLKAYEVRQISAH